MSRIPLVTILLVTVIARSAGAQRPDPAFEPTYGTALKKSPATARIMGIIPGAGHVYAGESRRGLAVGSGVVALPLTPAIVVGSVCITLYAFDADGGTLCSIPLEPLLALGIGAAAGLYGWSIYDAGRAAQRTNARRGLRLTPPVIVPRRLPSPSGRGSSTLEIQFGLSASFP